MKKLSRLNNVLNISENTRQIDKIAYLFVYLESINRKLCKILIVKVEFQIGEIDFYLNIFKLFFFENDLFM